MTCRHPKSWRVEVRDHSNPLVEWCAKCGAFRHHIEELVGSNTVASASFETWVSPQHGGEK